MPLSDHFRPPIRRELRWESFNTVWAVGLSKWLNRTLPRGVYLAQPHVHLGSRVEADVAEYERRPESGHPHWAPDGGVAMLPVITAATVTVPATFPDQFEVQVIEPGDSYRVVGVIELVSPANKKEADEREAFVAKCASYLQNGIGLSVIDLVTERRANLHNQLANRLGWPSSAALPDKSLYAVGYRPVRRTERNLIDVWPHLLSVGEPLPPVPFPLKGGPTIALDLEGTYTEALADSGF